MLSPLFGKGAAPSTTATNYAALSYSDVGTNWNATETVKSHPVPGAFTISGLNITVLTAPGSGKSYAYTLMKNGVATSLSATVSNTSTTGSDSSNTATFAAGDLISLRCVPTGTPTASGTVYWNMTASGTGQPITGDTNVTLSTTLSYQSLGFGSNTSTEGSTGMIAPAAGTISSMYVVCTVAPGGVATRPITLRVNGVSSALTATVTSAATTANDTTHSVSVAAGDRLNFMCDVTGTPAAAALKIGVVFTPTTDGDAIYPVNVVGSVPSTSAVNYAPLGSIGGSYQTVESNAQILVGIWRLKKYYFRTMAVTGAAKSFTVTVRKNTADTALTATATNTVTPVSATSDVDLVATDFVDISITPTGTPTASALNGGMLINTIPSSSIVTGSPIGLLLALTYDVGSVVNAAITQVAATVTASGGTQVVTTVNNVAITQSGATVTASGGTSTVSPAVATSVTQVAANVTATGGTQTIAASNNIVITQSAATVTASGGTQVMGSVINASITQVAATVTASGGTQVVASSNRVSITQTAATVAATGGTQSFVALVNAAIAQVAATVTATGGVQASSSNFAANLVQVSATVTASGGVQILTTVSNVVIERSSSLTLQVLPSTSLTLQQQTSAISIQQQQTDIRAVLHTTTDIQAILA